MTAKTSPPCKHCPFKAKYQGEKDYLRPGRRAEIARSVLEGGEFPCHETVVHSDDDEEQMWRVPGVGETACVGLDIVMLRAGVSGQMLRIRERIGELDSDALLIRSSKMKMWEWVDVLRDGGEDGDHCAVSGSSCLAPAGWMIGGQAVTGTVYLDSDDYCPVCGDPVCDACMESPEHQCAAEIVEDSTYYVPDYNHYPSQQRSPRNHYPFNPNELRDHGYVQQAFPEPAKGIKQVATRRPSAQ